MKVLILTSYGSVVRDSIIWYHEGKYHVFFLFGWITPKNDLQLTPLESLCSRVHIAPTCFSLVQLPSPLEDLVTTLSPSN